jgi:uncharacterized membrane protein YfcA
VTVDLVLVAGGAAAGAFGSLLGLGGGVLIVPLLTLGFGLPLREAVGVSLVSVIVTSSAAAGVYLERHVANLRLGMTLELFTATGALVGGLIAFALPERVLSGLFAALLAYTAFTMARRGLSRGATPAVAVAGGSGVAVEAAEGTAAAAAPDASLAVADAVVADGASEDVRQDVRQDEVEPAGASAGRRGWLAGSSPTSAMPFVASLAGPDYTIGRFPLGIVGSVFAGVISALLGVGGGIIKVPLMNLAMGVPLRVATATSNLMIGITASASAIVYFLRGGIDPYVAGPTAVGVFLGALAGSRAAPHIDVRILRLLFVVVLAYTAVQMALKALG